MIQLSLQRPLVDESPVDILSETNPEGYLAESTRGYGRILCIHEDLDTEEMALVIFTNKRNCLEKLLETLVLTDGSLRAIRNKKLQRGRTIQFLQSTK